MFLDRSSPEVRTYETGDMILVSLHHAREGAEH